MFSQNQNIYSQEWLETIFEGRNKQYGAYAIRRDASKNEKIALAIASTLFVLSLAWPMLTANLFGIPEVVPVQLDESRVIELATPPPVDLSQPEPLAAVEPPPPRRDQVRFAEPVVVHSDLVTEELPTVEMLKIADPGASTIAGNPDAALRIGIRHGEGDINAEITESNANSNAPFIHVEIQPTFPGGVDAFREYVRRNYRYPSAAAQQGVKGQIILQFVVERDGSLTDIHIVRDLGHGTGAEAIRLLKSSPNWHPGIQNGRPVRVSYTLPISLDLTQ